MGNRELGIRKSKIENREPHRWFRFPYSLFPIPCSLFFLCLAAPAWAATPTLVQRVACPSTQNGAAVASSANAYNCPLLKPTLAGNTLIAWVAGCNNGISCSAATQNWTITDTESDSFGSAVKLNYDSNGPDTVALYCVTGIAAGSTAVYFEPTANSSGYMVAGVAEFNNLTCTTDGTPASGAASSGSMSTAAITTTVNGDLVFEAAVNDATTTFSSVSFPSGWTGLQADLFSGTAAMFEVQATAGSVTPTITQGTSADYAAVAAAFKASSSATGSAAPTFSPIGLCHLNSLNQTGGSWTVQCPISGNAIVLDYISSAADTLTAASDGTNTFHHIGTDPSNDSVIGKWVAYGVSANRNESITLTVTGGSGAGRTVFVYDIQGAASASSPVDTGFGTSGLCTGTGSQSSGSGNVTILTGCTPTNSGEIILAAAGIAYDTATGAAGPSGANFLSATYTNEVQPSLFDENNFWADCLTCTGSGTWILVHNTYNYTYVGAWAASAIALQAGGHAYTANPSESNIASDALTRSHGWVRADSESNTASDALARKVSFGRGDSESNTASDVIARAAVYGRGDSESNTASDAIARLAGFARGDSESNTASDAIARAAVYGRGDSESNTASDSLARLAGFARGDSESNTASDAVSRLGGFARGDSETNTASDAIARNVAFERAATEAHTALDALARMAAYGRASSETNVATDAIGTSETVPGNYSATLYETNIASDAISRMVVYARTSSEVNATSDAIARLEAFRRAASETNPASDSLARLGRFGRGDTETLTVSDSLARSFGAVRAETELLATSDSLGRVLAALRGDAEMLAFSDAIVILRGHTVVVLPGHEFAVPAQAKTGEEPGRVKSGTAPVH